MPDDPPWISLEVVLGSRDFARECDTAPVV